MEAWRLSLERHAATAFSGEGARRVGGRWNAAGTPMVYTSLSLSLAALEIFVHLRKDQAPENLVVIAAEIRVDEAAVDRQFAELMAKLPTDWRSLDESATRELGEEWIASGRSLVLKVPSAVIDGEYNLLINPLHAAARDILINKPKPFHLDKRMFR